MKAFLRGADLSSLPEAEACGARFFDRDGREDDALRILARHGVDLVRLRLWHDPYSESGEPYGGGICDLPCVTQMARRVRALGLDWMLSFHYSDFWVDPGKQTIPKHRSSRTAIRSPHSTARRRPLSGDRRRRERDHKRPPLAVRSGPPLGESRPFRGGRDPRCARDDAGSEGPAPSR